MATSRTAEILWIEKLTTRIKISRRNKARLKSFTFSNLRSDGSIIKSPFCGKHYKKRYLANSSCNLTLDIGLCSELWESKTFDLNVTLVGKQNTSSNQHQQGLVCRRRLCSWWRSKFFLLPYWCPKIQWCFAKLFATFGALNSCHRCVIRPSTFVITRLRTKLRNATTRNAQIFSKNSISSCYIAGQDFYFY